MPRPSRNSKLTEDLFGLQSLGDRRDGGPVHAGPGTGEVPVAHVSEEADRRSPASMTSRTGASPSVRTLTASSSRAQHREAEGLAVIPQVDRMPVRTRSWSSPSVRSGRTRDSSPRASGSTQNRHVGDPVEEGVCRGLGQPADSRPRRTETSRGDRSPLPSRFIPGRQRLGPHCEHALEDGDQAGHREQGEDDTQDDLGRPETDEPGDDEHGHGRSARSAMPTLAVMPSPSARPWRRRRRCPGWRQASAGPAGRSGRRPRHTRAPGHRRWPHRPPGRASSQVGTPRCCSARQARHDTVHHRVGRRTR